MEILSTVVCITVLLQTATIAMLAALNKRILRLEGKHL